MGSINYIDYTPYFLVHLIERNFEGVARESRRTNHPKN